MQREVGGGIGMGNTCKPMAVSFQCMTKFTTNKKKKRERDPHASHPWSCEHWCPLVAIGRPCMAMLSGPGAPKGLTLQQSLPTGSNPTVSRLCLKQRLWSQTNLALSLLAAATLGCICLMLDQPHSCFVICLDAWLSPQLP